MGHKKGTGPTPQFTLRLDPEIRRALEAKAEADDRSLGEYIHRVLRKHVIEAERNQATTDDAVDLVRAHDLRSDKRRASKAARKEA